MTTIPSVPKLHYFGVAGRAEFIKLILEEADAPYEFIVHTADALTRQPLVSKLAFGQLPLWEEEGCEPLVQSGAIVRYLANRYSLYPNDIRQAARAEMVLEGATDFLNKYFAVALYKTLSKEQFVKTIVPQWMQYFDRILKQNDNGNGFIVGDTLTFADLALFQVLDMMVHYTPVGLSALGAFPVLKSFHGRIAARPNIASFLASERRLNP